MKKKILIAAAIFVGIVVLGGASFLAMRLINARAQGENPVMGGGPVLQMSGGPGGQASRAFKLEMIPSPDLPTRSADVSGIITTIKDNSLVIGTNPQMMVQVDKNGKAQTSTDFKGPTTEVILTKETKIYKDVTFASNTFPEEGKEYQQKLEEVDASDLVKDNSVTVWGSKRGDRLIAEIVVYHEMMGIAVKGK
jgi:hypothetical protein